MKRCILLSYLILIPAILLAQIELTTKSRKAEKLYYEGKQWITLYDFKQGVPLLEKAIEIDDQFIEAYLTLAEAEYNQNNIEKALEYYKKGLAINPSFYKRGYYNIATISYSIGKYKDALESLDTYIELVPTAKAKEQYEKLRKKCEFAQYLVDHPVEFNPVNLGDNINSEFNEYWPSLSADEQTLVFTVLVPIDPMRDYSYSNLQEDFYFSQKINNEWSPKRYVGAPLNTQGNEGAQTISSDGRTMIYTVCNRKGVIGRCDLYLSHKEGEKWTPPVNMKEPVNTAHKETQPSLSFNGNTLYFSSDRPGGKGGQDIWVTTINNEGIWSEPVNLGDSINTPGDELSPFIHQDNKTLYFSSNSHLGLGGQDIFKTTQLNDSTWSTPVNLGYPINTFNDEIGFIVNASGQTAYYSTDREKGKGKDIFTFQLYKDAQPLSVSYMKGKVYDAETLNPLPADFELTNLNTGIVVNKSVADKKSGEFLLALPPQINYMINVSHPGYLFYSENIPLDTNYQKAEPLLIDIPLQPIKEGTNIVLKNIFYETDKFELQDKSKYELQKLVDLLTLNPKLKVEVGGHTDNIGTISYNLELSNKRAKTVTDYLISKGINKERLTFKGYGQQKPIDDNETEQGRAVNRRTEITVIDID